MDDKVTKTEYGYEITWVNNETYYGKILVFEKKDARLSLHFHKDRSKSWFVNAGQFKVQWVDTKDGRVYAKELPEGSVFHVPALMPVALESVVANSAMAETGNFNNIDDIYRLN